MNSQTTHKKLLLAAPLLILCGLMNAAPAFAGPITHNGATFEVEVTNVVDADTADFLYTANFAGWMTSSGTNAIDYITVVEFNLTGNKVASVDSFSTTANGGTAVWSGFPANSSNATGCNVGSVSNNLACAEDLPFDEATVPLPQQTTGTVTWSFTVTFEDTFDSGDFAKSTNHIGAFFQRCKDTQNPNDGDARACTSGTGLSQDVSFDTPPDDPDLPVPAPGTLLLLGLGLFGMRLSHRKLI